MDGTEILQTFRRTQDESAFATLVTRYSRLVLAVARRRADAPEVAKDIAQTVFLRLAQSPPDLRTEAQLLGWFHKTAVHAAIDVWRSQSRRQAREQTAAAMQNDEARNPSDPWEPLAPVLDEALDALPASDREAILLRYFQEKPMRDVGQSLGISEDAAKMRISRALERLRTLLVSRGIGGTAAALAECLEHHALDAGPTIGLPPIGAAGWLAQAANLAKTPGPTAANGVTSGSFLASLLPKSPVAIATSAALTVAVGLWGTFAVLNRVP